MNNVLNLNNKRNYYIGLNKKIMNIYTIVLFNHKL